jgi:hypothetical protein
MARLVQKDMQVVRAKTPVGKSGCCHSLLSRVLVPGVSLVDVSAGGCQIIQRERLHPRQVGEGTNQSTNDLEPG